MIDIGYIMNIENKLETSTMAFPCLLEKNCEESGTNHFFLKVRVSKFSIHSLLVAKRKLLSKKKNKLINFLLAKRNGSIANY